MIDQNVIELSGVQEKMGNWDWGTTKRGSGFAPLKPLGLRKSVLLLPVAETPSPSAKMARSVAFDSIRSVLIHFSYMSVLCSHISYFWVQFCGGFVAVYMGLESERHSWAPSRNKS